MSFGSTSIENEMDISQKIEIKFPCDPALSLLGIYPQTTKTDMISLLPKQ